MNGRSMDRRSRGKQVLGFESTFVPLKSMLLVECCITVRELSAFTSEGLGDGPWFAGKENTLKGEAVGKRISFVGRAREVSEWDSLAKKVVE